MISLSDYIKLENNITNVNEDYYLYDIKIAILSSYTITGISSVLNVLSHNNKIKSTIYESNYNEYVQDILNSDSDLYKFKPDIIFLNVDILSLFGRFYFIPYDLNTELRKKNIEDIFFNFKNLISTLSLNLNCKIIVNNLLIPNYSPLGIYENKQEYGFIESITSFNIKLNEVFFSNPHINIFDFNSFCSNLGKKNIFNYKFYYLGDFKINPLFIPNFSYEYFRYIKTLKVPSKKCIILDLDNTLWGGVIGESSINEIHLGPTKEGRPFMEFQLHLLALYQRGIILAINSKNNYEDAMYIIDNHPDMILKKNNFASIKINWNNKVDNIKSIADELNIGFSSLVFIDDDNLNIDLTKNYLPEVTSILLPKDTSKYVETLMELSCFDTYTLTDEDINKGKMYYENSQRKNLLLTQTNFDDYIKSLEITLEFEFNNINHIGRVFQLCQKTNQFNLTTYRYSLEQIELMYKENIIITLNVSDKFGNSGLTGLAIIKKSNYNEWEIDTFLLSCRVLGRNIETSFLNLIINEAKKNNILNIHGKYIPTSKNVLTKNFYINNNFKKINETSFLYNLNKKIIPISTKLHNIKLIK
jgi:FkbH-like protein